MNIKIVIGVIAGVVLGIGGFYAYSQYSAATTANAKNDQAATTTTQKQTTTTPVEQKPVADVGYLCSEKKTIHAVYFSDKVIIELSDGRAMQLPQTISASGIRYANKDETYVFWSKGPTAFFQELGKNTYDKCAQLDTSSVEGM